MTLLKILTSGVLINEKSRAILSVNNDNVTSVEMEDSFNYDSIKRLHGKIRS